MCFATRLASWGFKFLAPATKHGSRGSQKSTPATKNGTKSSPNSAPARKHGTGGPPNSAHIYSRPNLWYFDLASTPLKTLSQNLYSDHRRCTTNARMPADASADAGRPLRRTTADAKNPRKKAADAFPAFEKYKVIQSNPPCGCPMAALRMPNGVWDIVWGGGGFLVFALLRSGESSP